MRQRMRIREEADVITRVQIARARARVALAKRTGESLPAEVLARAALIFGPANQGSSPLVTEWHRPSCVRVARARFRVALSALAGRTPSERTAEEAVLRSARTKTRARFPAQRRVFNSDARSNRRAGDLDYRDLAGVLAHGRDFGPLRQQRQGHVRRQLAPNAEEVLIDGLKITRASWEQAKAAVSRGELDALQCRSAYEGLVATMSGMEVEDWLEIGGAKRVWMLSVGELFAFLSDGELRYPTWQFTDDREQAILPHLSRLIPVFDDGMQPASILRFMTTPHERLAVRCEPVSPVDWLLRGGDVQKVVELLEARLMS